jgi:gliding motility-associated lipoprotein GldH
MGNKAVILISLGMLLMVVACKTDKLYEDYKSIQSSGWDQDSSAVFSFNIDKTFLNYNLFINIRNRGDYANSNLWLFVDITAPDYTCIHDTIEYQLALPSGKWIGKGTGGMFSNQFPFRENIYFPIAGIYTISIKHAMRNNPLTGISDIGIGVKRR